MTRFTSQLLRSVAVLAIAGAVAYGTTQSFAQSGSSTGSGSASPGASGSDSTGQGSPSSGSGATDTRRPDSKQGQSGSPSTTPSKRSGEATPSQGGQGKEDKGERSQSRQGQQDPGATNRDGKRSGAAEDRGSGHPGRADREDGKPDRRVQDQRGTQQDQQRTQSQDRNQSRDSSTQTRDQNRNSKAGQPGAAELQGEQRTEVRNVLSREGQRMNRSQINVNLSVGTRLPSRVSLRPLPQSVIGIVPQYRGYDYIYVDDEIVIVEPRTRRVVYVIDSDDTTGSAGSSSSTIRLTTSDRQTVRRLALQNRRDAGSTDFEVRVGSTLPEAVTLYPLPNEVVSGVPGLRGYRYVVVQDQVLLVAPNQREIIEVIQE